MIFAWAAAHEPSKGMYPCHGTCNVMVSTKNALTGTYLPVSHAQAHIDRIEECLVHIPACGTETLHITGRNAAQRVLYPNRNSSTGWFKVPLAVPLSPAVSFSTRVSAGTPSGPRFVHAYSSAAGSGGATSTNISARRKHVFRNSVHL